MNCLPNSTFLFSQWQFHDLKLVFSERLQYFNQPFKGYRFCDKRIRARVIATDDVLLFDRVDTLGTWYFPIYLYRQRVFTAEHAEIAEKKQIVIREQTVIRVIYCNQD